MNGIKIVIIDYGAGNIYSVATAVEALGYKKIKISSDESDIKNADALILPGVGAFDACIRSLKSHYLDIILGEEVLVKKKPILGICVGMQLMASYSEENGNHKGLDWIPGRVIRLELPSEYPVPHVGWNDVVVSSGDPIFSNISTASNFYFDHSFHYECESRYVSASCVYGKNITAAIGKENIHGVQFHPEKSQTNGLKLFRSFFNSVILC
jgi:glutamine amidotransferase